MTNHARAFLCAAASSLVLLSTCATDADAYPGARRAFRNATRHSYYGVDTRQNRQQNRIYQGNTTGQLTARENARLQARQTSLAAQEAHYRSTNGLQPRERRRLENRQDKLSTSIYKQKHDAQQVPVTTTPAM